MIRLLVADDHQIVIDGVKLLLGEATDAEVVAEANSGEGVLAALHANPDIDVALLDISMPGMNGIQCCRRIRQDFPGTRVVALTMISEYSMIRDMLEAGANGYLLKNCGHEELLDCIRAVAHGGTYYHPEVASTILAGEPPHKNQAPKVILTRREKQVLQLIVNEMTTAEIADELDIGFGTVETHRRNIMQKLGAKNTAGIVRIALEQQLIG